MPKQKQKQPPVWLSHHPLVIPYREFGGRVKKTLPQTSRPLCHFRSCVCCRAYTNPFLPHWSWILLLSFFVSSRSMQDLHRQRTGPNPMTWNFIYISPKSHRFSRCTWLRKVTSQRKEPHFPTRKQPEKPNKANVQSPFAGKNFLQSSPSNKKPPVDIWHTTTWQRGVGRVTRDHFRRFRLS